MFQCGFLHFPLPQYVWFVNERVSCGGIGRSDLYLSDIELCKSSSGVLWCTAVHWCDQSLWVWSAVIITALHSLKSTFVCLVSIENVLLLVEVLTHYMSEFLVIFHGGKSFIHHAMEPYRMKPILRRPIIFPLWHYFHDNIPQFIYLFLHSFINYYYFFKL